MVNKTKWISSERLMLRWGMDENGLVRMIERGLPAYKGNFSNVKSLDLLAIKLFVAGTKPLVDEIPTLVFMMSDVKRFERQHVETKFKSPESIPDDWEEQEPEEVEVNIEQDPDFVEFWEEQKIWEDSIVAAFHIGMYVSEKARTKEIVTKEMLARHITSLGFTNLSVASFEKLWDTIPAPLRATDPTKKT